MCEIGASVRDNEKTAVSAGHGVSKALDIHTSILTTHGWIPLGELTERDRVFDEMGSPRPVQGLSPVTIKPCFRVTFDDGSTLDADADHLWSVHDYLTRKRLRRRGISDYRSTWNKTHNVTTRELAHHVTYNGQNNFSIPLVETLRGCVSVPYAYTLGLWLGDGTRGCAHITAGDQDKKVLDRVAQDGFAWREVPSQRQEHCGCYLIQGLHALLREQGILTDKHVPTRWLNWTPACRRELIRGFMDADGYKLQHGHTAAFGVTCKPLFDGICTILHSLGVKIFRSIEIRDYRGRELKVYHANFSPAFQPFWLPRKQINRSKSQSLRRTARYIIAVEPIGDRHVRCLKIETQNHLFCAGSQMVPTHNSFTAAQLALWFLYSFVPSTVITTAPTAVQVEDILWREIRESHIRSGLFGQPNLTDLDLQKLTGLRWFAKGFSTRPDTITKEATNFQGYHNDHLFIIFDEAAGVAHEIWHAAEYIGAPFKRWLTIGNATVCVGDFADALQDPKWHRIIVSIHDTPNYQTGKTVIPGVYGRKEAQDVADEYGEDSDEYAVRVKGEISKKGFEGSYYGALIFAAEVSGRIGDWEYDESLPVYAFWDLGHAHTAVIFVQFYQSWIHIIDSYSDDSGLGIPIYAKVVNALPYNMRGHWAGADTWGSNAKSMQTGKTTIEIALEHGLNFQKVEPHERGDRIEDVRIVLKHTRINKQKCGTAITAWKSYRKRKNIRASTSDRTVFIEEPETDWDNHFADALGHMARVYRHQQIDGRCIGDSRTLAAYAHRETSSSKPRTQADYDPRAAVLRATGMNNPITRVGGH